MDDDARGLFVQHSIAAIGDQLRSRLEATKRRLSGGEPADDERHAAPDWFEDQWAATADVISDLRSSFERPPTTNGHGHTNAAVIEAGDTRLDRRVGMAWIGDRPITLGPTEFELLALFLANAGSVIHRATLEQKLFGDHPSADAALDAELEHLRRKLENDDANPTRIVQVGDGYRYRVR